MPAKHTTRAPTVRRVLHDTQHTVLVAVGCARARVAAIQTQDIVARRMARPDALHREAHHARKREPIDVANLAWVPNERSIGHVPEEELHVARARHQQSTVRAPVDVTDVARVAARNAYATVLL